MTAANPAADRWTDRLNRAGTRPQVAEALEGADQDLLGPLHQFLERAAERFREHRDDQRAAAFDAHAETLRELSDELAYSAEDLRNDAAADRTAAALLRRPGPLPDATAPAPGPGPAAKAGGPVRGR